MPPKRKSTDDDAPAKSDIFEDCIFSIAGSLTKTQADLKKMIERAGGKVSSTITKKVTHVLSNTEAVNEENVKLEKAVKEGVPNILKEDYLHECIKQGKKLEESKFALDTTPAPREDGDEDMEEAEEEEKVEKKPEKIEKKVEKKPEKKSTKKAPIEESEDDDDDEEEEVEKPAKRGAKKKVEEKPKEKPKVEESHIKKVTVHKKGRAAVDSECPGGSFYHVLEVGGDVYTCMLNQTDISFGVRGHNKFYVIQALEKDSGSGWAVFTKWGRVGLKAQSKMDQCNNQAAAIKNFEKKFADKTKNKWANRANFEYVDGKYDLIEMDDNAGEAEDEEAVEEEVAKKLSEKRAGSKLDKRVQDLVKLLFDMNMFSDTLLEMHIDVKKMPLGKISRAQIEKGYAVLEELEGAMEEGESNKVLDDLASKFYRTVPHNFGARLPDKIHDREQLQHRMDLLEVLLDMEVASKMMEKEEKMEEENPVDAKYKMLCNDIVPVEKDGDEWKRILTYIENTSQERKFTLMDAFKVARHGEDKNFEEFSALDERRLLWHGSKVAVFAAILSTGLRIMPHSGGRVGRGLYFADILYKSSTYCGLHGDIGLLLLNEVALGKINRIQQDDPSLIKPPPSFDSVLACGTQAPDSASEYLDKSLSHSKHPVIIPQGKIVNTKVKSSFIHNEYLVYDAKQVNMKYLLKMKFHN